ncbi:MAG: beta-propeller fold lactonase family protein [Halieaceae bacterium]|jgi:DNA-binding beta-propeller fold protein YncE|nr:beta-propeller fold lactonase family protein [Halieaceae bacterium]
MRCLPFRSLAGVAALTAAALSLEASAEALVDVQVQQFTDRPIPRFQADAAWPTVPGGMMFGQVPGLALDADDNVWMLHRPNSLTFSDTGLAQDPPIAVCCRPAPHILQFSPAGELLAAWGGPDHAPSVDGVNQWPVTVHGLHVAEDGSLWIAGNGDGDHVVLNFTPDGEFRRSFGHRNATGGNYDRTTLGGPADVATNPETGEVLVADGYINKRIIGFDENGEFTRFWGAYGASPDDETREGAFDQSQASSNADGGADPESRAFGDIVHCVVQGPDDRIYVCDRRNNRLQIFETAEDGSATLVENVVIAPGTGGTRTVSDVAFSPDGRFLYVADMMNGQVWILDASTYEQLGALGRNGRYPGQFIWLHSVVVDSEGNLYTSEVGTGRRVQKFVFSGVR